MLRRVCFPSLRKPFPFRMNTLTSLHDLIATQSLLKHPFYQKWSKGELTKEDLAFYAKEYFHLVERIPGIVARVHERATDAQSRLKISGNIMEEQEHTKLWKRFARSLGISEKELLAHVPSMKTQQAIRSLEKTCEESFEAGVAAVYAIELELPKIAETKKQGLSDFYGLTSEDAQIYFDEHLKEEEHLQVWRSMPMEACDLTEAARTSMAAQNQVLDAVCEGRGISMDC